MSEGLSLQSKLKEILSLKDDELDEDLGIALTSLITTAVHDKEPRHNLIAITAAVRQSDSAPFLEPLTVVPIVVKSADEGTDSIIDLISAECSAKELVMAVEEAVEALNLELQTADDEAEDDTSVPSPSRRLSRLIRIYAMAIPRLPKWKKSPAEAVESRLNEIKAVIALIAHDANPDEGQELIASVSKLSLALAGGADDKSKEHLRYLVEVSISAFPNANKGTLAKRSFATHFSRLVIPHPEASGSPTLGQGDLTDTWSALEALGMTAASYESRPSLTGLILLAHDPAYSFSVETLTSFFPVVLSSVQLNVALDEVLSILISTLAPLHRAKPRPELSTDLVIPLVHLFSHLASNHSEPDIRHYTFRIVSLALGLSSPPLRFRLLQDLLSDKDLPQQMRVASVGLLKEAVLEGLAAKDNIFASPHLLATFGPIVLRPDPPDLSVTIFEFLDSAEPLRLVESLGFYYVLLMRDTQNRTGVRDSDSLATVQRALLRPIRARMEPWKAGIADAEEGADDHDSAMQLGILEMWLERVEDAVENVSS